MGWALTQSLARARARGLIAKVLIVILPPANH